MSEAPESAAPTTYGPSALATPANALTVIRLLLAPVAFGLIVADTVSWTTWAVWAALTGSDGLDGWLARRYGTTRSGAFLDPLADKVLIIGGMVALVSVGRFWWVPVGVIIAREVAISLYRSWWGRQGVAVPASPLAKLKTLAQAVAVGFAVWPPTAEHLPRSADAVLWLSVGLAVVSGVQYIAAGQQARTRQGSHSD